MDVFEASTWRLHPDAHCPSSQARRLKLGEVETIYAPGHSAHLSEFLLTKASSHLAPSCAGLSLSQNLPPYPRKCSEQHHLPSDWGVQLWICLSSPHCTLPMPVPTGGPPKVPGQLRGPALASIPGLSTKFPGHSGEERQRPPGPQRACLDFEAAVAVPL